MKKKLLYSVMAALPMLAALTSCDDKEEIIFDHELPQFETRADAILLEVIMPSSTTVEDKIYISGAFNGGDEVAVGDPQWQLEKAQGNDVKWGIYLNPSTFIDGFTLADGFHFVNKEQGVERTLRNEDVVRTDNPAVGTRTNLTVDRWKVYFDTPVNPDEVVHDGYVIYVVDNTGYDELAMYAWGDAEAFGGWPGMSVTGTLEMDGVKYKYFDTGEANKGLNLSLIFNNAGAGSQLGDFNVTLDRDYYLELTESGVTEFDPTNVVTHDGFAVFVVNNTGWADADLRLYMWGDANDLNGAWPGMEPTGAQTINGVNYLYFDMGEANTGLAENLIFSNNGASQLGDFAFTIDRDIYLELSTKVTEIDPESYTGGTVAPEPEPEPTVYYNIYVEDLTGWETLAVYAYGDTETFGAWPGKLSADCATVNKGGRTFYVFEAEATTTIRNLIFNNNNGTQFDGPGIIIDRDYYFSVTDAVCTEIDPATLATTVRIYAEDNTGWSALYLYAWGDKEIFGAWPGATPTGTETIEGVTYSYWEVEGNGESENLIFNNNAGTQFDGPIVTMDRDWYMSITAEGFTLK